MEHLITYSEFEKIEENKKSDKTDHKHEFGCVMLKFNFPDIKEFHKQIDNNDIYEDPEDDSFGLEKKPHVTLLFGLHSDKIEDDVIMKICEEQEYSVLTLHNVSIFESKKYDVLKFDVKGTGLKEVNKKLSKLPHTTDFPKYHAHSTIGYLLKGTGKTYIEKFKDQEFQVTPTKIIYSKPDDSEITSSKVTISEKE